MTQFNPNRMTLLPRQPRRALVKTCLSSLLLALITVVSPLSFARTTTQTYNALGLLETIDGPRTDANDVTTLTYNASGDLIQITNALGHTTQITAYDAHGRPLTIVDPNGALTTLTYDARGRLLTRTVAGATTTFAYDGVGNVIQTTMPNGAFLSNAYDAAHRLVAVADNLGNRIEYTLDALGNRIQEDVRDPQGTLTRTLSRTYNDLNRLVATVGGAGQTTAFAYDGNGNPTAVTVDPAGLNQTTAQAFDGLNRLRESEDPEHGLTTYAYDARDNLISVTDPRGLTTSYTYDGLDNLLSQTSPDTGTTTFTADEAGNRTTQTDARGITTTYTYDALNRLTNRRYPNPAQDIAYRYDGCGNGSGRLCAMQDEAGTTTYAYDARGNRLTETADRGLVIMTLEYAYNDADQLVQITYPSGRTVDYARNALGQIDTVTTTHNAVTETLASNLSYRPFGPLAGLRYGNGLDNARNYDLDYRLTTLTTGTLQGLDYTLDAANNITMMTNTVDTIRSQSFGYDARNRLTGATGLYGTLDYSYDDIGNRLTAGRDSHVQTYTYAPTSQHLLQTVNGSIVNYAYDGNGNTTSTTDRDFIYGDPNRLQAVQVLGVPLARYVYNGSGQRVRKDAADTTLYYYDPNGQLLAELEALGATHREYLYLDGLPLALVRAGPTPNPDPEAQTLDNTDPSTGFVGAWPLSTAVSGYTGANYQTHAANGPSPAALVIDNTDPGFSVTGNWPTSTAVSGYQGTHYQHHFANGPSPAALGVDNTDPGFSASGAWTPSTAVSGYLHSNYQAHAAGTGQDPATWTFPVPTSGDYQIYARWTQHSNRASNAAYTIAHSDGLGGTTTTTVTVNQKTNGGIDNLLGVFRFDAGPATVTLSDAADGYVIADAVQLVPPGAGPNTVTWNPPLTQAAEYEVLAQWTSHPNRATNATYTITHVNGAATIVVNQQTNGGIFNSLGTFTLDQNSTIQLSDEANGYVIADAVKISRTTTPPPAQAGIYYYVNDHLGTPQTIMDRNQNIVWAADYEPFGQATITTETLTNNLRFPGQYFDAESGLHHNGFRPYDPGTGRYLQSDPIGLAGGLNTYAYVNNNPLNGIDPLGLYLTRYGNWCGRYWSGGQKCREIPPNPLGPIDSVDNCCLQHDYCWAKYECIECMTSEEREKGKEECDKALVSCLDKLKGMDPRRWPLPPKPGTETEAYLFSQKAKWWFK